MPTIEESFREYLGNVPSTISNSSNQTLPTANPSTLSATEQQPTGSGLTDLDKAFQDFLNSGVYNPETLANKNGPTINNPQSITVGLDAQKLLSPQQEGINPGVAQPIDSEFGRVGADIRELFPDLFASTTTPRINPSTLARAINPGRVVQDQGIFNADRGGTDPGSGFGDPFASGQGNIDFSAIGNDLFGAEFSSNISQAADIMTGLSRASNIASIFTGAIGPGAVFGIGSGIFDISQESEAAQYFGEEFSLGDAIGAFFGSTPNDELMGFVNDVMQQDSQRAVGGFDTDAVPGAAPLSELAQFFVNEGGSVTAQGGVYTGDGQYLGEMGTLDTINGVTFGEGGPPGGVFTSGGFTAAPGTGEEENSELSEENFNWGSGADADSWDGSGDGAGGGWGSGMW